MKNNHIPRNIRLMNRLRALTLKSDNCWRQTHCYPSCKHCGITNVQLSIDGDHYKGCKVKGIAKEIIYWRRLIKEEEKALRARRIGALAIYDPTSI